MISCIFEVGPVRPTVPVPSSVGESHNAGPGFALIANKAGRDREDLSRFMGEWHELGKIDMAGIPMPTILLSDAQRADVITYILTYRLDLGTGAPTPAGVRPF